MRKSTTRCASYTHKFKTSDLRYIELISTLIKDLYITAINGIELKPGRYRCKDLPTLLNDVSGAITLQCEGENFKSTAKVFPPLYIALRPLMRMSEKEIIEAMNSQCIALPYFVSLTSDGTGFSDNRREPKRLTLRNAAQAAWTIDEFAINSKAREKAELYGVHLVESSMFVFQCGEVSFAVTYGESSCIGQIEILFDIEDGFVASLPNTSLSQLAASALQKHHVKWKDSKYFGDIFPGRKLNKRERFFSSADANVPATDQSAANFEFK